MKIKEKKIIITLISLFLIWNLIWVSVVNLRYNEFLKDIPKNKWGRYFKEKDGYIYSVKKPDYLRLTGNLAVNNNKKGEALIIWPLMFGGYKYGFRLQKDGLAHEIYVDEHMEPINKENKVLIEKYNVELKQLFDKAKQMWEFDYK
ncbi:hypothetical protein [Abyssisolibacter fermentans]|uniref:hypothetical protein n=1 Tax=Abyssisolibacter fermentans TaxID=1766203 RepID=UPI000834CFAA|nr:hypothetical protein [Abyssisolibacter fermentans]